MSEANATTAPVAPAEPQATPVVAESKADGAAPVQAVEETKDLERRAAILARAKRESAKNLQVRQKLEQERALHADALKKAAEWDRLTEIRQKQGDYALFKELNADFGKASREYINETTGQGKSPVEAARLEAQRVIAEERAKAEAESTKRAQAEEVQRQRQALAGARTQLENLIKADPKKYELSSSLGDMAVSRAWKLIEDFHAKTGQILDFTKAVDAVETDLEDRMSKSEKVAAALERQKAAAVDAAKAQAKVKGVASKHVETEDVHKSPPTLTKRPRPLDMLKLAKQMAADSKVAQDN